METPKCWHGNGPECKKCKALDIPEVEELEQWHDAKLATLRAQLAEAKEKVASAEKSEIEAEAKLHEFNQEALGVFAEHRQQLAAEQETARRLEQANFNLRRERDRAVEEAKRQDGVAKGLREHLAATKKRAECFERELANWRRERDRAMEVRSGVEQQLAAATARAEKAEKALAEAQGGKYRFFVWTDHTSYLAVAHARSVEEARQALEDNDLGGLDGSCPEREKARKVVFSETPAIYHGKNAEFCVIGIDGQEELVAERDALKAASAKDREQLGRALDKQAEYLKQCQAVANERDALRAELADFQRCCKENADAYVNEQIAGADERGKLAAEIGLTEQRVEALRAHRDALARQNDALRAATKGALAEMKELYSACPICADGVGWTSHSPRCVIPSIESALALTPPAAGEAGKDLARLEKEENPNG